MDKYKKVAEKRLNNTKVHPDQIAKEALVKAEFSSQIRNDFFDEAYGEILVEYFINWLKTEPHETKAREFIYGAALALGDVKSRLITYETYGKNIPHMEGNDG
jgi:hypothetical protein